MFRIFILMVLCVFVVPVYAEPIQEEKSSYHKGLLNSPVLFSGGSFITFREEPSEDSGFQSYGLLFKAHPKMNFGISGGYEIQGNTDDSPRFYVFDVDFLYHFRPSERTDPYIEISGAYLGNAVLMEDGLGFGVNVGIEHKPNRFVSIIPNIFCSYVDAGIYDYSTLSSDLTVAFRFSDEEKNRWSKLWFAPSVSAGFGLHESSTLPPAENTYSIGLRTFITF